MVFKYGNNAARYVLESRSCVVPRLHSLATFRLLLLPQLTIDLLDVGNEIADRDILREEKNEMMSVGAHFVSGNLRVVHGMDGQNVKSSASRDKVHVRIQIYDSTARESTVTFYRVLEQ